MPRLFLLAVLIVGAACSGGGDLAPIKDGGADAAVAPPPLPYARPTYTLLSQTGLYADRPGGVFGTRVRSFQPTFTLWTDGATKRRWIALPPGTQIDTSDMDHWVFPVGTKVWKEFTRDGVVVETRLIERHGVGPDDYWMGAFVWNPDRQDATFMESGQVDANGTPHDVPAARFCSSCHGGEPGRLLGLSALQSQHAPGETTLASLLADNLLSTAPPQGSDFRPPGDPATAAALGYLHANCGHCHNPRALAWRDTMMVLRVSILDTVPESSAMWQSLVGARLQYWRHPSIVLRVAPGDPAASAVPVRMRARGSMDQMPPLATEIPDMAAIEAVESWIASLAPAP